MNSLHFFYRKFLVFPNFDFWLENWIYYQNLKFSDSKKKRKLFFFFSLFVSEPSSDPNHSLFSFTNVFLLVQIFYIAISIPKLPCTYFAQQLDPSHCLHWRPSHQLWWTDWESDRPWSCGSGLWRRRTRLYGGSSAFHTGAQRLHVSHTVVTTATRAGHIQKKAPVTMRDRKLLPQLQATAQIVCSNLGWTSVRWEIFFIEIGK